MNIHPYSSERLAIPIAEAQAAGLAPDTYILRTGMDAGVIRNTPVVCLAIRERGPTAMTIVEPCIPALLAAGFHVERGLNAGDEIVNYRVLYYWDGSPGTLVDVQRKAARISLGVQTIERRPGVWPLPSDEPIP